MAFGFGFNKQKVLGAAEKCVQQGKLQNAITEYEKVLKHDTKDLTVMNTIGDLHARLGETDKAAECFKSVGDAYASQGFTVKAIAMYKKLSKIKASMECVLRLAELYTQQGLFNDARAQYLQVAEEFLRTNQLDQAVKIFEKTLEMDPDNVAMRTKLAEVYIRLGKKPAAWQILTTAAESLRSKGQLAAADEILQRMLKLEPNSSYALLLRGKAAIDAGDAKAAIEALSQIADLDSNAEGLRALFQAYLRAKNFTEAGTIATKLANVHDDSAAISEFANALIESQQYPQALQVYEEHADRLLRSDPAKLIEALRPIIGYVKEDTEALEKVLALQQKAGENTHVTEIYELLAHAYVQSGNLEKARDYYLKLTQLEPANQMHAQNYQQVLEKQGSTVATPQLITAEEGSVLVDELEATAPFLDQRYDDEVALAVRSAMTDAELFISYNMPAKALAPLLSALPKAPRDLRLNQKLAALHTRAGKFAEAALCCQTLQSLYHDAGHAEEAARYGDLATKYEERSGVTPARTQAQPSQMVTATSEFSVAPGASEFSVAAEQPAAEAEFAISAPEVSAASDSGHEGPAFPPHSAAEVKPAVTVQKSPARSGLFFHAPVVPTVAASTPATAEQIPVQAPAAPAADFLVGSEPAAAADLAGEWEQDLTIEAPQTEEAAFEIAAPPVATSEDAVGAPSAGHLNLDEAIEEVRFYLGQGMVEQAEQVLAKLEALAPGSPELAVLRLGVDSAKQSVPAPEMEVSIEEPQDVEATSESATAAQLHPWPQQRPVLQEMVSEIEHSLGNGFLAPESTAISTEPVAPEPVAEQPAAEIAAQVASVAGQDFRAGTLDEFVSDLEASLGSDFLPQASAPAVAEAPAAAQMAEVIAPEPTAMETPVAMAAAASAMPSAPAVLPSAPAPSIPAYSHSVEAAPVPAPVVKPQGSVDLSDMFGDLKNELEEGVGPSHDEDPETHYNLGVAFREMGLLDEAIGEFQKVCQASDRGHAFSQLMQTYTWLAQCFLDKGVPEAAVRWYERALKIPNLDGETRTALHYELASSLENAGNKPAALTNFLEVYGNNIDYRDVAERIKALRT